MWMGSSNGDSVKLLYSFSNGFLSVDVHELPTE